MSDLISRKKVMWILTNLSYTQCKTQGEADVIETAKTLVITMPPAQPEPLKIPIDHAPKADELEIIKQAMRNTPVMLLPPAQPEITLESAIDYLHSIGWMQEHDRILSSAQPERCEDCENFSKTRLLIPQPDIIRCRDCKWYGYYSCKLHGNSWMRDGNGYCDRAERKE